MEYELQFGELTQLAEYDNQGINSMWEDDDTEICDYLKNPENFSDFHDGIVNFINIYHPEIDTDKKIMNFIKNSAKEKNILYDDTFRTTMGKWMKKELNPQANENSKDKLYRLCFILGLTYKETIVFFQKVCLMRPFNCRNRDEAIYLFCFANNKGYNDFVRIKEKIHIPKNENKIDEDFNTSEFITKIENKTDEQEFIKLIENNDSFFSGINLSAINECNYLFDEAIIEAKVNNSKQLLEAILTKNRSGNTFHNSDFLKLAKTDFPSEVTFSNLKNRVKIKDDELRKTIILLEFYLFCKTYKNYDDVNLYEDFVSEINDILNKCGYPPIYWRNPYDCIFLHCMMGLDCLDNKLEDALDDALGEFRSIIFSMLHMGI